MTFTRQVLQELPDWADSRTQLTKLHVATDKKIEDDGVGMLQVCVWGQEGSDKRGILSHPGDITCSFFLEDTALN